MTEFKREPREGQTEAEFIAENSMRERTAPASALKLFAVSSYYGNYHEVAASDADEAYGIASNYFERHHMGMVVAVQEIADRTAPIVKPVEAPTSVPEWPGLKD